MISKEPESHDVKKAEAMMDIFDLLYKAAERARESNSISMFEFLGLMDLWLTEFRGKTMDAYTAIGNEHLKRKPDA